MAKNIAATNIRASIREIAVKISEAVDLGNVKSPAIERIVVLALLPGWKDLIRIMRKLCRHLQSSLAAESAGSVMQERAGSEHRATNRTIGCYLTAPICILKAALCNSGRSRPRPG